jgi:predicted Na+-dependent transporter
VWESVKTLSFPAQVLGAGVLAALRPGVFACLSDSFVTRSLSVVMALMGMTLTMGDFTRILSAKQAILLGW